MWTKIKWYKEENANDSVAVAAADADNSDVRDKWQMKKEHIEIVVSAKYTVYVFFLMNPT